MIRKLLVTLISGYIAIGAVAQSTSPENPNEFQQFLNNRALRTAQLIEAYKAKYGEQTILQIDDDGTIVQLVGFEENGRPIFYQTDNTDAAESTSTDHVQTGGGFGYSLTGGGINLGEWDGGAVRGTHVELVNRITQIDNPSSNSNHATHVAGTMIASGVDANAEGMAYQATISAHDFFNDEPEMLTFSQGAGAILSNHSYGRIAGWRFNSQAGYYYWYGDTAISQTEDYIFGFYDFTAQVWDSIARNAPDYLIVKSAGNDRNDNLPVSAQDTHFVWDNLNGGYVLSTLVRPADCPTGYDCISASGVSKNILTVGAVGDISGGYSQPSDVNMSSFSGWGPTDDGRIKPDIVGNGVSLYSSGASSDTDYYNSSGTSMSAPNVTGSLALIQEHHNDKYSSFMRSSTLKALVLHTADEAGSADGPDYEHGWGMMNTLKAVQLLDDTASALVVLDTLVSGDTITFNYYYDGNTSLRATICWTDPAATALAPALDPTTSVLINDLDLRVEHTVSSTMHMPYILNPAMPSMAATTGDNVRDNVEQVYVSSPTAGMYSFQIRNKGSLTDGPQEVSVVIEGFTQVPANSLPVANFTISDTSICDGDMISLTDNSTNSPISWSWEITNGVNTFSSPMQNPMLAITQPGIYDVTLIVSNGFGNDTLTQQALLEVDTVPTINFNFLTDVCLDAGQIGLNPFNSTPGGIYSGSGVVGNLFDPIAAGIGSHIITYTYTTPGGCTVVTTDTTVVIDSVTVSHVAIPPVCTGSTPYTLLGGTPAGGVYSGTGVTNGIFDPNATGIGAHLITYAYTNSGGCSDSVQFSIQVINGIVPNLGFIGTVCSNGGVITLTGGSPIGGIYTGPGVDSINGTFDPSVAGLGTHIITYTATNGICIAGDTGTIAVVDPAPVTLTLNISSVCVGGMSVVLSGGAPAGGTYSGVGVSNGTFDPSAAGVGLHDIYYTRTDNNGCISSDTQQVDVTSGVTVSFSNSIGYCENFPAFSLTTGLPAGGTYSGPGVTNNEFSPSNAGVGSHTIYYNYSAGGCSGVDSAIFTVFPTPIVTFNPLQPVCVGVDSVALTASPSMGVFSGTGVSNGFFFPGVAGIGIHTISYTAVDSMGCSATETQDIEVISGNSSLSGLDTAYCESDPSVTLSGSPNGGVFLGNGVSGSSFNPANAGAGTHMISYATSGECADTSTVMVVVQQTPLALPISGSSTAFQGNVFTYSVQAVSGVAVTWLAIGGTVVSSVNNIASVEWGPGLSGQLVATQSIGGCETSSTLDVVLWPVGTEELQEGDVTLYPNPADEACYLESTNQEIKSVLVIDIRGTEHAGIFTRQEERWVGDLTSLAGGTYFVAYTLEDESKEVIQLLIQ